MSGIWLGKNDFLKNAEKLLLKMMALNIGQIYLLAIM